MSNDLTPEEYLARLNAEAASASAGASARATTRPVAPTEPAPVMQPGQTLREVLTEQEIAGLLAFARRTGGAEAERSFEEELDTPYDPTVDDAAYAGLQTPAAPGAPGRRVGGKGWLVALAVGGLAIVGVVAGAGVIDEATDDGPVRNLAEASGVARDRGEEAVATAERFTVPATWEERAEPEISMNGDEESSYAFYKLAWELPRDADTTSFQRWFENQPEVAARSDEATCTVTLSRQEATCEVDFFELGVDGNRDYDQPHQTATFRFFRGSPSEGTAVFAEMYASN